MAMMWRYFAGGCLLFSGQMIAWRNWVICDWLMVYGTADCSSAALQKKWMMWSIQQNYSVTHIRVCSLSITGTLNMWKDA